MSDPARYFAFISYSRKDSRAAAWLQKRLEWFRFPVKLVAEERRPPHARYIRPVYRDKTNLEVTDEHYWTNIRQALEQSRYLVVLCSPHSAKSEPVNMEVSHFLQVHGGDTSRVVPVILSGAVVSSGEDAALCSALRDLGEELINRNLPSMVPDADTAERDAWESGFVALSSYLLHLQRSAIGDHIQRESRRQARTLRLWLAAVIALGLIAAMTSLYAWQQKDRAEGSEQKTAEALSETQRQLEFSQLEQGRAWLASARTAKGEGDHLKALMFAGRAVGYVGYGRPKVDNPETEESYPLLLSKPFKDAEAEKQRQEEEAEVRNFIDGVEATGLPVWSSPIQAHHHGRVSSVAWSADGSRIASGAEDRAVKVWDAASGKELTCLRHSGIVSCVAFSSDGRCIASGSMDRTVKLWDAANGKELATLQGHEDGVASVTLSADGRLIASGAWDNTVKLWDVASGKGLATLKGHEDGVISVAFSADSRHLISGSRDQMVKLWDAASGKELASFQGQSGGVTSVALSSDGSRIALGSEDKLVRLWDAASGKELATFQGHTRGVTSVAFSRDGSRIASGSRDHTVKLWNAFSGKELTTLHGHEWEVSGVAFSPDGSRIISGAWDRTVKLWDAASGKELAILHGHNNIVSSVAFSPDGSRIASGAWDRTVKVWDAANGRELATLYGHAEGVNSVAFSPDGSRIASGSEDKTVKVWDVARGRELTTLHGHTGEITSVAFNPDGRQIASGSRDQTVKLWDTASGKELASIQDHKRNYIRVVSSLAFSPDGSYIASGTFDGTVNLWDAASGKELAFLTGHADGVTSVAFSPNGSRIASGSEDKTVKVWETKAANAKELITLWGHTDRVTSVAFSPDGRRIVSGSEDQTVKLWDADTGKELATLQGHVEAVTSVAFSPDGSRIASGAYDRTVKLRDLASVKELAVKPDFSADEASVSSGGSKAAEREQNVIRLVTGDGNPDLLALERKGFLALAEREIAWKVNDSLLSTRKFEPIHWRPDFLAQMAVAKTPVEHYVLRLRLCGKGGEWLTLPTLWDEARRAGLEQESVVRHEWCVQVAAAARRLADQYEPVAPESLWRALLDTASTADWKDGRFSEPLAQAMPALLMVPEFPATIREGFVSKVLAEAPVTWLEAAVSEAAKVRRKMNVSPKARDALSAFIGVCAAAQPANLPLLRIARDGHELEDEVWLKLVSQILACAGATPEDYMDPAYAAAKNPAMAEVARDLLSRLEARFPEDEHARRRAGWSYINLADHSAALRSFIAAKATLKLDEKSGTDLLAGLSLAQWLNQKRNDAIATYKQLIETGRAAKESKDWADSQTITDQNWPEAESKPLEELRQATLAKFPELKK